MDRCHIVAVKDENEYKNFIYQYCVPTREIIQSYTNTKYKYKYKYTKYKQKIYIITLDELSWPSVCIDAIVITNRFESSKTIIIFFRFSLRDSDKPGEDVFFKVLDNKITNCRPDPHKQIR